jgi:hypothetical protein
MWKNPKRLGAFAEIRSRKPLQKMQKNRKENVYQLAHVKAGRHGSKY